MPGTKSPTVATRRKGSITPLLLLSLLTLLAAFAIAVDYIFLWQTRVEMQAATDSASLAGVQSLVDDDQLTGDPAKIEKLLENARASAIQFAAYNRVLGQPVVLDANSTNLPDGDIVLGTLDHPRDTVFYAARDTLDPSNTNLANVNAIHVANRRTRLRGNPVGIPLGGLLLMPQVDVVVVSGAMLDRDVVGFQFASSQPLPLAPIALQSDPTAANQLSWEYNVVAKQGPDQFRFDRTTNAFVADPQGDGLHEIKVTLAQPGGNTPGVNAVLLSFGAGSPSAAASQLANGLVPADLANQGGMLVLGPNNQVMLPGSAATPTSGSTDFTALENALSVLQASAAQRIWPLYVQTNAQTGVTTVEGFVAARVVQVATQPGGPLSFILQPTMLATPDAVTDYTHRGVGGVNITNPYIVKLRLVQ